MSWGSSYSCGKPSIYGKVYPSKEIEHAFVEERSEDGYCRSVNEHFIRDAFYSYNTVIGRRIRHKKKVAYVLDRKTFSPTTSGHQQALWCALGDRKVFTVYKGCRNQELDFTATTLRDHYLRVEAHWEESKSPIRAMREKRFLAGVSHLDLAIDVCEFFGLPDDKPRSLLGRLMPRIKEANEIVLLYDRKLKERREERWELKRLQEQADHDCAVALAIKHAKELADTFRWSTPDVTPEFNEFFGCDFRLLDSDPTLKVAMIALKLKCVEREAYEAHNEVVHEKWALEERVEELEKRQPKLVPFKVNLGPDRLIRLE